MEIIYKNKKSEKVSQCEKCFFDVKKTDKIRIEKNRQYVFYSEENFRGKSFFADGSTHSEFIDRKELNIKQILSIREFTPEFSGDMLIPSKRDNDALNNAVETWWSEDIKNREKRLSWWKDARFGCFVHWGVYSNCGGTYKGKSCGYTCHIERAAKISQEDYKKDFIDKFNPVDFDAEEWIKTAKNAGMQYFIITAKHHDGFCIYPSDAYGYDITMTPFKGRDPLKELADACRKYDMKFGFYYSHAYDWEHADAPGNDWEYDNYGGTENLFSKKGMGGWYNEHPEMVERTSKYYVDEKSIPQILELINRYSPDILWFDTPHKLPLYDNLRIIKAIRDADPEIVVNGRLARCDTFPTLCDYMNTGDRASYVFPMSGYWENIPTTNESYAYNKKDRSHKKPEYFIKLIAASVARGGNVLMNIGPMGNGEIEDVDKEILKDIGSWFDKNAESIRGCGKNPLPVQNYGEVTAKGNVLYLHIVSVPSDNKVILAGLLNNIQSAYVLEDENKTPLEVKRLNYYDSEITVPARFMHDDAVIKVTADGEIMSDGGRLIDSRNKNTLLTFDADVIPAGTGHGDGKKNQNYVCGFKYKYQQLLWHIRTNETKEYTVKVHYKALNGGGSYLFACGQNSVIRKIKKSLTGNIKEDVFDFKISNGRSDIIIAPDEIKGNFAQFFDIELIPSAEAENSDGSLIIDSEKIDLGDR